MPIVAACPTHGPFASRAISATSTVRLHLSNNWEQCPKCGAMSPIMEGVYNLDADGLVTVLSAPGWSVKALKTFHDNLAELAGVIERDDPSGYDEIMARLSRQDEQLAQLVRASVDGQPANRAKDIVVSIMAVLGGIVTLKESGQLTYDAVRAIVNQFIS